MSDSPVALLVEDDEFARSVLSSTLSGFQIYSAGSGKNAIEMFQKHDPDIVFLDIELPDANGQELLKQFMEKKSDVFIVMVTGNSDQNNVIKAVQNGAKGYITKPFAKTKIDQVIDKFKLFVQSK